MVKNRLTSRIKSEDGNAVLIMGIAIFGLILLLSIFIVDLAKNRYMATNYNQMAQRATQIGLKQQNSIGGLTPDAAQAVVDEYLEERTPKKKCVDPNNPGRTVSCQTSEISAFRSICAKKYPSYPEITISFSDKRNNKDTKNGFESTFVYSNGHMNAPDDKDFYRKKYKTIKVQVKDYGDNYFYSMFGQQCNIYNIEASAVAIDSDAGDTGK